MKRKMRWVLLQLILLSFFWFFGNSEVMAEYPYPEPPDSCTLTDVRGVEQAGYTLEIRPCGGSEGDCVAGEWPIKRLQSGGSVFYEWRYKWSGVVTANQLSTVVPICSPTQVIYDPVFIIDSGEYVDGPNVYNFGEPASNFAVWDGVGKTVRISNVTANGTIFSFYTKSDHISPYPLPFKNTYFQLKSGTKATTNYCRAIKGPDCPNNEPFTPVVTTTDLQFPDPANPQDFINFRYLRDSNNCIAQVQRLNKSNNSWETLPWETEQQIGAKSLLNCAAADFSGRCSDCLLDTAGSPHKKQTCSGSQCVTLYTYCLTGEKSIISGGKVADCVHSTSCPTCTSHTPGNKCCTSPGTETGCTTY